MTIENLLTCRLCGKQGPQVEMVDHLWRVCKANDTPEQKERETLIYWLLRAYHSGHREGWEEGPSTDETMDGLLSVLANRGYDPNEDDAAKQLLKRKPRY